MKDATKTDEKKKIKNDKKMIKNDKKNDNMDVE